MAKQAVFLVFLVSFLSADNFLYVSGKGSSGAGAKAMSAGAKQTGAGAKAGMDFSTDKMTNKEFIDGKINHFKEEINDVKEQLNKQKMQNESLQMQMQDAQTAPQNMPSAMPRGSAQDPMPDAASADNTFGADGFFVQLGAFKDEKNARGFLESARAFFSSAKMAFASGYYKVAVGPFPSAAAARKTLSEAREDFKDAFLTNASF
ncbi:MAG: SPOR domain-containing protein [Helicobacteraceae bacterium]